MCTPQLQDSMPFLFLSDSLRIVTVLDSGWEAVLLSALLSGSNASRCNGLEENESYFVSKDDVLVYYALDLKIFVKMYIDAYISLSTNSLTK